MRTCIIFLTMVGCLAAQGQYKKIHRDALRQIVDGKPAVALKTLRGRIAANDGDPEDWFMVAIAEAARQNLDAAAAAVERVRRLGFPEGRLAVAFQHWLRPLRARYPELCETPHIAMGPMVGAVGPHDARVWVRTTSPATVVLSVAGRRVEARTEPASDCTAVLHMTGLESDTAYEGTVDLRPDSGEEPTAAVLAFRTAPTLGSKGAFTLAFGGGAGFTPRHEHMWSTIAKTSPDLLLLLGDNVYIDHPKHPDVQRYCYHRRQASPPYRALTARVPTFSIWDDHDFGTNDCKGGPAVDTPPWKRDVWDVFVENWANPGYGGGVERPGCWYSFSWGAVDFFMLDGRAYRERPKGDGSSSMLGPHQLRWLKQGLKDSKAVFKVICSPVPWATGTKGKSKDTWDGHPQERAGIYRFLSEHRITGVVQLSADRHRSDAWLNQRPGGYPIYEFNSSRLTNVHKHAVMKRALFSYNATPSFGFVRFEPGGEDPGVSYEVINIAGDRVHRLRVPLSALNY